ncbi:MAG: four helix bundle protein [Candidatus Sumerlaeota bacterium]|nr:four helix bundle protein [Candidatus Sumerlaeota bacterium]
MSNRVERFEDLNVYQEARLLTGKVYDITKVGKFAKDFGLVDYIRRAVVSIMSNIAEGFERGANKEFIQYLYYSKGSCGEVRSHLNVAFGQGYIDKQQYDDLYNRCCSISSMLAHFINYLSTSKIKGIKFKHD